MKVFDNITDIVRDDMAVTMKKGSKVSIENSIFHVSAESRAFMVLSLKSSSEMR